ncbi:MAG TPA: DNA repair protein RadC [Firmicutes bacterium]|nr:DNA repair protein RadC [Bacillota bacterium]
MSFTSINIFTLKQIRTYHHRYDLEDYPITTPQICYEILQYILDLKSEPVEKFGIISLNAKNKIIGIHIIGIGSLDKVYIEPREVFMAAMLNNAKSIIAFHNHPSGEPEPSHEDIYLTCRLQEAGKILSIELFDHVITGERNYVSLKEKGFL